MAKVIHQLSDAAESVSASATRNIYFGANSGSDSTATEANRELLHRITGTYSKLSIRVLTNDRGASTLKSRLVTANGNQSVSIGASTTGWLEDASNTDAVSAGDDWHCQLITGAGGSVFTYNMVQVSFTAGSDTVMRTGCHTVTGFTSASTTRYTPLFGSFANNNTESLVQTVIKTAATLKNLYCRVTSNGRSSTTTLGTRVNGVNGNVSVSVGAGSTGAFEDTSNTDTLSVEDAINAYVTTGTGTGTINFIALGIDIVTTNSKYQYVVGIGAGGVTHNDDTTLYYAVGGLINGFATEADSKAKANNDITASKLQCNISANTVSVNSTLKLRKNGADGNQAVTIMASTTGVFEDASNTDTITETDEINYALVAPLGGTSMTIRSMSMLAEVAAPGGSAVAKILQLHGG